MSTSPAPSRNAARWRQFSLRTLMVLIALCCAGLLVWNVSIEPYQREHRFIAKVEKLKGKIETQAAHTWLRRIVREEFFVHVRTANLSGTAVDDAWLPNLRSVPHLWFLHLSGTRVGDAEMMHVGNLRELQILDLSDTQVTEDGLVELSELKNLEGLELGRTAVTDAGLAHLRDLSRLKYLNLTGCPITGAGLVHLGGMHELEHISLNETPITNAELAHLVGLDNLKSLALDNTEVSEGCLPHLQQLPAIQQVSIVGTQIVPSVLWSALPGLEDKKVARALENPMVVQFVETPLADVAEFMSDYHKINVHLDRRSLQQTGLSVSAPVTADLQGVTLAAALQQIHKPLGLKCVTYGGALIITTPDEQWASRHPRTTLKLGTRLDGKVSAVLHDPTVIEFINTPLGDVCDYLSDYHKFRFQCQDRVRKTPTTTTLRGISLATALELMLDDLDLRGEIQDDTIVFSQSAAQPSR